MNKKERSKNWVIGLKDRSPCSFHFTQVGYDECEATCIANAKSLYLFLKYEMILLTLSINNLCTIALLYCTK